MSPRINVIDSSVLLAEGKNALYKFGTDNIVLPLIVIIELENKRNDPDLGYQARSVLKEVARLKELGDIKTGISLGKDLGEIRVEVNHIDTSGLPATLRNTKTNDIRILAVAHALQHEVAPKLTTTGDLLIDREAEFTKNDVVLITQDIPLQILASIVGVPSEALEGPKSADVDSYIKSIPEFDVSSEVIDDLYKNGQIILNTVDVPINTAILLKSHNSSALAMSKVGWAFSLLGTTKIDKIESKSKEQAVAIDHLMNNDIGVVSLGGRAGSGKSMLSLAAAIKLVMDGSTPFEKIVIFRPMNAVGGSEQELGFLPGTLDEKLAPIMEPVFDCIATFKNKIDLEKIKKSGIIEFRSIAHARGSSLANCIILIDEAQNLSKATIGTLLTRAGVNSRVFLMWDVNQVDAKYIGKFDGIFRVVRFLLGKKLFAHVSLIKSERSPIAEMASGILEDMV
jgi:PhoH-like ATPase